MYGVGCRPDSEITITTGAVLSAAADRLRVI